MRVFLHIGTNKTGTSAIQNFLYNNPELLASHKILYPSTGRGSAPAHHTLAESLAVAPERANEFRFQLLKEAEGFDTIVLSSEAFRVYPPGPLAQMLYGIPTEVVVYLRPHMQHLSSWYREGVKSRNFWMPFSQFIAHNARPHHPWLNKWASHFPLDVTRYDRRDFEYNSVLFNFLSKLSFPQAHFPDPNLLYEQNPSISGNLLYIKRDINQFITESQAHELIPEVLELATLKPSFSGAMRIPDDIAERITRVSEPDVQKIEEAFKINIADAPDSHLGHLTPDLDTLADDAAALYDHSQARKFKISPMLLAHVRT